MDTNYFKNGVTHSRSIATTDQYLARASQLIEACTRTGSWDLDIPISDRVERLFRSLQPSLKPSTQRLYKASLAAYLESVGESKAAIALRSISTIDPGKGIPRRTSALKAKTVTASDLAALAHASHKRSHAMQAAVRWLAASTLTGLRPVEWSSCSLIERDGRTILILSNAKATHGRSHGPTRGLDISEFTLEDRQTVALHLAWLADQMAAGVPFDRIYHRTRKSLQELCTEVFPGRSRRPCLYSGRHQFSATAKRHLSLVEVAALLGHATTRTAPAHYQSVRFAGVGSGVKPLRDDVAKVRDTYTPQLNLYPQKLKTGGSESA